MPSILMLQYTRNCYIVTAPIPKANLGQDKLQEYTYSESIAVDFVVTTFAKN